LKKFNRAKGIFGEDIACQFLEKNGYKILERNFKNFSNKEIDIIAKDKNTICFIEVKARSSDKFGLGLEAVSGVKQKQISKVALSFLKEKGLLDKKARFDVVSLDSSGSEEKITLIKNAFELDARFAY